MTEARRREYLGKLGRFATVGVINTIIDFVLYGVLVSLGTYWLVANVVSTSAGMTFGFFAHRTYSFRSRSRSWRTAGEFLLATLVGLWVVQPIVITSVARVIEAAGFSGPVAAIWTPKACGIGAGMLWSFLLYNFVVFDDRRHSRHG